VPGGYLPDIEQELVGDGWCVHEGEVGVESPEDITDLS
jgi:hypothetical protein